MGDEFDQYKVSSQSSGDEFARYKVATPVSQQPGRNRHPMSPQAVTITPDSPVTITPDLSDFTPDTQGPHGGPVLDLSDFKEDPPPLAAPRISRPKVNVQPESVSGFVNRLTGHEGYQGPQINPLSIAAGAARDVKTLTLGGAQAMVKGLTGRPILGQPPSSQQTIQSGVNIGTGMLLGGLEGEGLAPTRELNRTINPSSEVANPAASSSPGLASIAARHIPIVGRVLRMGDTVQELQNYLQQKAGATARTPTPAQVVPTTNGVQWGTGGQGPLDLRGQMIPQPMSPADAAQPIQLGRLPLAKGDPYAGPRTPAMTPAQSTTIAQHGYDAPSQTMVVQFTNGKVYDYRGVPPEIYSKYQQSESQGSFFANNIKGRYATQLRGSVKAQAKPRAATATAGGDL